MFGVRFSSSTSSSNYPLEITALTVVSPFSGGLSKLQHFHPVDIGDHGPPVPWLSQCSAS
jgi:hypothetical protein